MEDIRTTKVLVAEAQQGNRLALNELCDRYFSRVLVAVRARLGVGLRRKVESWDVVQEVMIDAVRNLDEFNFRTEVPSSITSTEWSKTELGMKRTGGPPRSADQTTRFHWTQAVRSSLQIRFRYQTPPLRQAGLWPLTKTSFA